MKINITYILVLLLIAFTNTSCEEEEAATFEIIGESTDTITDLSLSNSEPAPGEEVDITFYYVNISEDPAEKIDWYVKIGDGQRMLVETFNESSASQDAEITRTVTYSVPELAAETEIVIDMELFTQRTYPKITRTDLTVTD
ncbi:MAG: hypothetical protein ACNS62_14260 [Candidatus Cyclobacteriaceae bacterium M3_2C_046]